VVTRLDLSNGGDVDALSMYEADRVAPASRPYVLVNMVASLDGAVAVDGVTKALGHPTDRAVFLSLRVLADAVLVGSTTIRSERYGPVRPTLEERAARSRRGQLPTPPVVVVSKSMCFDWDSPFFAEAAQRPIIFSPDDTSVSKREQAAQVADVVACGSGRVDLVAAMAELRRRGIRLLLCEGGPTLNAELFASGLVDELCLTVAPLVVAGAATRGIVAATGVAGVLPFTLVHVLKDDGFLFLRYRREG